MLTKLYKLFSGFLVIDTYEGKGTKDKVLFSCHDVDRAMSADRARYSPILEGARYLVEDDSFTMVNLSHPFSFLRSEEIKDNSITINYKMFLVRVKVLAARLLSKSGKNTREFFESRLYEALLKKLSPKAIFSIQPPPGLCLAAKRLGISVIELMHANNLSKSDKIFRAHMLIAEEFLPDTIVCFDSCTKETVDSLVEDKKIKVLLSNDLWFHYVRSNKEKLSSSLSLKKNYKRKVLISLQWGYDGERESLSGIIPNGIMHPELESIFSNPAHKDTLFLIRMHPIQRLRPWYKRHREYISALANAHSNVEFEYASSAPLPLILEDCNSHITMSSSCVGEAALVSVPSLLLCPTLHENGDNFGLFRELENDRECVTFGNLDAGEIESWISNNDALEQRNLAIANLEEDHARLANIYKSLISE